MGAKDENGGWTFKTLHAYFARWLTEKSKRDEQRYQAQEVALTAALTSQEKAVNAALAAADRAVAKAEAAAERRFESVNEFRGSLSDMQTNLMPRQEAENRIKSLEDKLDAAIKNMQAATDSHFATNRTDIANLQRWQSEQHGSREGSEKSTSNVRWHVEIVVAVLAAVIGGLIGFIFKK